MSVVGGRVGVGLVMANWIDWLVRVFPAAIVGAVLAVYFSGIGIESAIILFFHLLLPNQCLCP